MYHSKQSDDYSIFSFLRVYIVVAFTHPPGALRHYADYPCK